MADRTFTPLVEGYTFLEGPRWHDGRLWLSDFYTHKVIAVADEGKVEEITTVPQQPSGLGWLPDGTLRWSPCATAGSCASKAGSWWSTPTCPRWPPGTSTTWSSTPKVEPTSATSASTS